MDWTALVKNLSSYVPVIVALISFIPALIGALAKRQSDIPTSQAEAVSTLIETMQSMYDPLNERVRAAEAELARSRRTNQLQREIINTQTDYCSYITTGVKVLHRQLVMLEQNPNFQVNGEMATYRRRIDALFEQLRTIDAC